MICLLDAFVVVSILELPLVINNFGIPTHRFDVIARVNDWLFGI